MILGKYCIKRYYQHNTGKHLSDQQEIQKLLTPFEFESCDPISCQTGACHTDDHGCQTGDQTVHRHFTKVVGVEKFMKRFQRERIRKPLRVRIVGLCLCLECRGQHPQYRNHDKCRQ